MLLLAPPPPDARPCPPGDGFAELAPVGAFEDTIPDAFVAVVEVAVDEGIAFDGVPTSGFSTLGYEVLDEMVPINIARSFPRKTLFSNYYIDMFLLEQQTCQD